MKNTISETTSNNIDRIIFPHEITELGDELAKKYQNMNIYNFTTIDFTTNKTTATDYVTLFPLGGYYYYYIKINTNNEDQILKAKMLKMYLDYKYKITSVGVTDKYELHRFLLYGLIFICASVSIILNSKKKIGSARVFCNSHISILHKLIN